MGLSSVLSAINPYAGLIGAGLSFLGGERRNKAQVSSAREQMAFQERMSNTAHQRQIKDMKTAGLNPILSAKYGGSSSPGGAMPQIQDTLTPAITTGFESSKKSAETSYVREQLKPVADQMGSIAVESYLKIAQRNLANIDKRHRAAGIAYLIEQANIARLQGTINTKYEAAIQKGLEAILDKIESVTGSDMFNFLR